MKLSKKLFSYKTLATLLLGASSLANVALAQVNADQVLATR